MYAERVVLHFPRDLVNQPIIHRLVKDFGISFNILKAQITADDAGMMVLAINGERSSVKSAVKFLKSRGVSVQPLDKDIAIDFDRCTHCGACVGQCPTSALIVDADTRLVSLDPEKCIACENCVPACPYAAISVRFD